MIMRLDKHFRSTGSALQKHFFEAKRCIPRAAVGDQPAQALNLPQNPHSCANCWCLYFVLTLSAVAHRYPPLSVSRTPKGGWRMENMYVVFLGGVTHQSEASMHYG